MSKVKAKMWVLNIALFTALVALMVFVGSIRTNISEVRNSAMLYEQKQIFNGYKVFLSQMHNDVVEAVEKKELNPKDHDAVIDFIARYGERAKTIHKDTEFLFIDGTNNVILSPINMKGKIYPIKSPEDFITYSMEIPLVPEKGYYFIATCQISMSKAIPVEISNNMNQVENKSIYTMFITIVLYVICMITLIWHQKGKTRCQTEGRCVYTK